MEFTFTSVTLRHNLVNTRIPVMNEKEIQLWRTRKENVFLRDGEEFTPPADYTFVPAGDGLLTRRLKALGEYFVVVHKRKNRIEALGIWTKSAWVDSTKRRLGNERATPAYQQRLAQSRKRREAQQDAYVVQFRLAVVKFLNFAPRYKELAWTLADAVTDQAVPVGSGTVARTERIPLEERAEAAVIAWMRHQTTAYDNMSIARIKGERRMVRRMLAERSRHLLDRYRAGLDPEENCPLAKALK